MKILFLDKKTGEKAKISHDCNEFLLNEDGIVFEICIQHYNNFFALLARDDVYAVLQKEEGW